VGSGTVENALGIIDDMRGAICWLESGLGLTEVKAFKHKRRLGLAEKYGNIRNIYYNAKEFIINVCGTWIHEPHESGGLGTHD
jgi:hypothetical protein